MTAQIAPQPVFQAFAPNGRFLVGGQLFTYAAGTSMPQATYVDATQTTPNTNPVILNSMGQANVWLIPTLAYKFVLKDAAGNTLWTVDQIQGALAGNFNVINFGADPTGVTDSTVAIQNAVNAAAGALLFFPGGRYKITTQINILNGCTLLGVRGYSTIVLSTQNMNGFVIGDGTLGGQTSSNETTIDGFVFAPSATVAAFTSGSCIFLNYCYYTQIKNCFVYGTNGAVNILFNGMTLFQATEPTIIYSYFYHLLGKGLYTSGTSITLRTVDGRFDFNEFVDIANHCVHLDVNTAGCTINCMVAFTFSTWGIFISSGTSGAGSLHYISQCDIEADGTSGGINIQNSANIDIDGGWIGTNVYTGTTPSLWIGAASNSVKVTGMQLQVGRVQIDGPACNFTGCDIVGDSVAATAAYGISSTATDTSITGGTVRQHATGGVQFTSTPPAARCKVVGVNFKACGPVAGTGYEVVGSTGLPGSILGVSGAPGGLPPVIRDCQSDVPYGYAAAATGKVVTSVGRDMYQVTASANITTITNLSLGNRVTFQAGVGGITVASGGNLSLKTSPTTIAAGNTMSWIGDGQFFFEDGRNF